MGAKIKGYKFLDGRNIDFQYIKGMKGEYNFGKFPLILPKLYKNKK
tara:strand:+ start:57512 stop:57649 length:138 start_codon:yes stop_codon:yes gene_type:complete